MRPETTGDKIQVLGHAWLSVNYRDVDARLDMRLEFSVEFDHPIIPLIEKEVDVILAKIQHSQGKSHADLLLRSSDVMRIAGIITAYRPRKIGDTLVVRIPGEEIPEMTRSSHELMQALSAVPEEMFLTGNRMHHSFRFHSSDLARVSGFISGMLETEGRLRLEDLGPAYGGINAIERINSKVKLSMICYEISGLDDIPGEMRQAHYGEVNVGLMASGEYRAVLYPEDKTDWKSQGHVISEDDGIYSESVNAPVLRDILTISNERGISSAAILGKGYGRNLKMFHFLPSAFRDEQIGVIQSVAAKSSDYKVTLIAVRNYARNLWEWV